MKKKKFKVDEAKMEKLTLLLHKVVLTIYGISAPKNDFFRLDALRKEIQETISPAEENKIGEV